MEGYHHTHTPLAHISNLFSVPIHTHTHTHTRLSSFFFSNHALSLLLLPDINAAPILYTLQQLRTRSSLFLILFPTTTQRRRLYNILHSTHSIGHGRHVSLQLRSGDYKDRRLYVRVSQAFRRCGQCGHCIWTKVRCFCEIRDSSRV